MAAPDAGSPAVVAQWWLRAQVSRDAPPPLPGGYPVGERLFFTGASQTVSNGDKLVHGQQGEVTGPANSEETKGKGVSVRFPGNKGNVSCYLTEVRRLRAVSTATPPPAAPHTRRWPRPVRVPATQPLPRRRSPHCMSSSSLAACSPLPGCSAMQRGRRPRALPPPYSLRLVAACAGEPQPADAAAGRRQGRRQGARGRHGGEPGRFDRRRLGHCLVVVV